jgi:hypothetical protein
MRRPQINLLNDDSNVLIELFGEWKDATLRIDWQAIAWHASIAVFEREKTTDRANAEI